MLSLTDYVSHGLWLVPGWAKYDWLCHGLTTSLFGNLALHVGGEPSQVIARRIQLADSLGFPLKNWVCADQVHQTKIAQVTACHKGRGADNLETALAETDGLITNETGILLACFFADCVPLFFLVPERRIVGVGHAGWRGAAGQIAARMVESLVKIYELDPSQIHAAVGPSIGKCCYQVGSQVARQFSESVIEQRENGYYLDLKQANCLQLEASGIKPDRIHCSSICTCCGEQFFSYRRSGIEAGRMAAVIGINHTEM